MENSIKGVNFGSTAPHVTHLLFADDNIVFLEGSQSNLLALKDIFWIYKEASGQKGNLQKSYIFFGKGCEEDKGFMKKPIGNDSEALSER